MKRLKPYIETMKASIFENGEDRDFFDDLFSEFGGIDRNSDHFDFRNADEKREEFNQKRKALFDQFVLARGKNCELRTHVGCAGIAEQVDHLIPLSTNVLNKVIRKAVPQGGKKVLSQSFGSNRSSNLVLACGRCNAFKKHRLPTKDLLGRIKTSQLKS